MNLFSDAFSLQVVESDTETKRLIDNLQKLNDDKSKIEDRLAHLGVVIALQKEVIDRRIGELFASQVLDKGYYIVGRLGVDLITLAKSLYVDWTRGAYEIAIINELKNIDNNFNQWTKVYTMPLSFNVETFNNALDVIESKVGFDYNNDTDSIFPIKDLEKAVKWWISYTKNIPEIYQLTYVSEVNEKHIATIIITAKVMAENDNAEDATHTLKFHVDLASSCFVENV